VKLTTHTLPVPKLRKGEAMSPLLSKRLLAYGRVVMIKEFGKYNVNLPQYFSFILDFSYTRIGPYRQFIPSI
jgi:hypothetical protein